MFGPHIVINKAVANGPVGQVLARPLFLKGKNKVPFYKKQVINKSTRVIFGLVQLVILRYSRYVEVENNLPLTHARIFCATQGIGAGIH